MNFFSAEGVGLEVLFDEEEVDDDDQRDNHATKLHVISKTRIIETIDAKDYRNEVNEKCKPPTPSFQTP